MVMYINKLIFTVPDGHITKLTNLRKLARAFFFSGPWLVLLRDVFYLQASEPASCDMSMVLVRGGEWAQK